MGFRFRKRIKIAPGISLNLSRSGVSTSLGGNGLTVNVGRGKMRTTVGISGTGISYSTTSATDGDRPAEGKPARLGLWLLLAVVVLLAFLLGGK